MVNNQVLSIALAQKWRRRPLDSSFPSFCKWMDGLAPCATLREGTTVYIRDGAVDAEQQACTGTMLGIKIDQIPDDVPASRAQGGAGRCSIRTGVPTLMPSTAAWPAASSSTPSTGVSGP